MSWSLSQIVIQVFCTLAIFTFLYKDNPIYKFAEHLFVGVATGWWIVLQYRDTLMPNLFVPLGDGYRGAGKPGWGWLHIPLLLGLLLFMRLSKKHSYFARWSMAVIVGTFAGLAVKGFTVGDLFIQVRSNIIPLFAPGSLTTLGQRFDLANLLEVLRNPVLIVGTITVLVYFFFSVPHKGAVGKVASVGIWFLMVSFGASYGNTVMARISLFIGRAQFLLTEQTLVAGARPIAHWPLTLALAVVIILALVAWEHMRGGDDGRPAPP